MPTDSDSVNSRTMNSSTTNSSTVNSSTMNSSTRNSSTVNSSTVQHQSLVNGEREKPPSLFEQFRRVRSFTEHLTEPLETEDFVVQTVEFVSPTKWHLAHTSWFFEVFVLQRYKPDYRLYHPEFPYLFNSYYVQAGERHCRDRRGYISRPTVKEVFEYRAHVDEQMSMFLADLDAAASSEIAGVVETGIHHEQQHQELILTDIKHVLSVNPLRPAYRQPTGLMAASGTTANGDRGHANPHAGVGGVTPAEQVLPLAWKHFDEGIYEIGHAGQGFCYDNELPRHRHFAEPFLLANRPVTNGEYLEFMEDGGYRRPELWLSDGVAAVDENEWTEPFYWEKRDGAWWAYTLGGMRKVAEHEPVCHLSYFEADAYARWADARLPTEQEWEIAARAVGEPDGNFVEKGHYHPVSPRPDGGENSDVLLEQMYGDVWEWTRSQYSPYPGYKPLPGALGEYNGKFMCNQFVLRGGSCATSQTHIRPTYRNFFSPESTWQFTGLRLARDI